MLFSSSARKIWENEVRRVWVFLSGGVSKFMLLFRPIILNFWWKGLLHCIKHDGKECFHVCILGIEFSFYSWIFCCLVVQDDFGLFLKLKSHLVDGIRQCIDVLTLIVYYVIQENNSRYKYLNDSDIYIWNI